MIRWIIRISSRHFLNMNRKLSYLATILVMVFLLAAYLQQNGIQEYSRYNWLQSQGNRELLSLQNSVFNNKVNPNSKHLSQTINILDNNEDKKENIFIRKSCKPKYNIVFLKTHKCASSTIQNIFMRNGFISNKVFVLPAKANYLGHPMPFNRNLVPNPLQFKHEYNILTHHSRLNYESMRSLMPNNTLFITIVRDPVDLFESMFHYYRLDKFWNITFDVFGDDSIQIPNKLNTNRYIGKIGINQMTFDLGLNISDFTKSYTVRKYIKKLDSIFDLVMVSERMDESLVLLKHLLCWTTDDIIAFKLNARHMNAKSYLTETSSSRIRDLNWADVQLYKYFSQKFSLMVKAFGSERMSRQVSELKNRTNEWFDYCVGTESDLNTGNKTKKSIIIRLRNQQKDNTTCWLLTANEMDFTKFLRIRQMKVFPGSVFRDVNSFTKKYNKLQTIANQKRIEYLRAKLLLISNKYQNVCKHCTNLLPEEPQTTTIDPSYQLADALKNITFRVS